MGAETISQLVRKYYDRVVELRRYFHTYPELSNQEFNTQHKIREELQSIGISSRKIAETGVMADVIGGMPGKMIALRADMDALKVPDGINTSYRSVNQGVCHACGHDGHMAILLGVAHLLQDIKPFPGTIRLLFQPAEEEHPGGAKAMVEQGALHDVDAVVGLHLWQAVPVGTIGISNGKLMASPDEFSIEIQGRGGHGSMPHQTVDPLLTGAQIVLGLNTIVGRNVNPLHNAVVSICMFQAGEVFNVIPDTAILRGTVRTFEEPLRSHIFERIEQITKGICEAAGATYILRQNYGFPPVINSPEITELIVEAMRESTSGIQVVETEPVMAGEDFSYFQKEAPGSFVFVGAGNSAKGIIYPQHHPQFDIDEESLAHGLEMMVRTAMRFLRK